MVLEPQRAVGDDEEPPPRMLRQPVEPPPPLGHVGDAAPVGSLRQSLQARRSGPHRSLRLRTRAWLARVTGRADRHLLSGVADATDAIAAHCDALSDRLAAQEALTADVASVLGEEITRLRAEVTHLRRIVEARHDPTHD